MLVSLWHLQLRHQQWSGVVPGGQWDAGLQLPLHQLHGDHGGVVLLEETSRVSAGHGVEQQCREHVVTAGDCPHWGHGSDIWWGVSTPGRSQCDSGGQRQDCDQLQQRRILETAASWLLHHQSWASKQFWCHLKWLWKVWVEHLIVHSSDDKSFYRVLVTKECSKINFFLAVVLKLTFLASIF